MEVNKMSKPTFFTLSAKLQLNVHDLNNEAVAGNVADIRMIEFIDTNGRRIEAPAVSGRMLKHYHFAFMRDLELKEQNPKLCDGCKAGEPIRPGKKDGDKISQIAISEDQAVQNCIVCDTHGYLIAQEAEQPERGQRRQAGVSNRRNSRVMFSWLLPSLDSESSSKQVVHTRVSQQIAMQAGGGEQKSQMIFYKSYASGMYGFVSAIDLERIGYLESQLESVLQDNDWKHRAEIAIKAYQFMLSGALGASLSHAIPHTDCKEVLVAVADDGALPFPISPIYPEYGQKYIGLLELKGRSIDVYTFGLPTLQSDVVNVTQCASIAEIFNKVLEKINQVK